MDELLYKKICEILDDKNSFIQGYFEDQIKTPFDLTPLDYLKFAEEDLLTNNKHKHINALSNSKRALDCQLDTLLIGFGLYSIFKKKNLGFPKKIDVLKKLEVIAPRILSKVNKTRNLMEHEYLNPELSVVEDFLDVVALFVEATNVYVKKFITSKDIFFDDQVHNCDFFVLEITVNYKRSIIEIETRKVAHLKGKVYEIKNDDNRYMEILKRFLKVDFEH